jgi:hypothetical protein
MLLGSGLSKFSMVSTRFSGNFNAFCHAAMLKEAYRYFEIDV